MLEHSELVLVPFEILSNLVLDPLIEPGVEAQLLREFSKTCLKA